MRSGNTILARHDLSPAASVIPRVSRAIPVVLPAATVVNNQTVPSETSITQSGTRFYVLGASAAISIQSVRAGAMGAANSFFIGQGQPVEEGFDTLTVKNQNPNPVVALIWVGFDDFINDQLILANSYNQQVAFPTYTAAGSLTNVPIKDLSGTIFTDINGKNWGAMNRVSILVFNVDTAIVMTLQRYGASGGSGPAVGAIQPATALRFDFSGDYAINLGGTPINAIISEIYNAIPT